MKRLLILLLFLSQIAQGQTITGSFGAVGTATGINGTLVVNQALTIPTNTTFTPTRAGSIRYKLADNTLEGFTGSAWVPITSTYTLPTASTVVLGGVKVDGNTINIASGVISASYTQDVTYSQLTTAISGSTLIPGRKYRITDFHTVHTILGTGVDNTGATEPLVVTATSSNTLSPIAFSPSNPTDIIHYSVTDATILAPSAGSRGVILYRKDVVNNLSTHYDFREVKWRRWAMDATPGLYYAFQQYGAITANQDVLTFSSNNKDIEIGPGSYNVTIESDCFAITIGKDVGTISSGVTIRTASYGIRIDDESAKVATTGSGYIGGIFIGSNSRYINIGKRSYNIAIGNNCYAIDLGLQNSDIVVQDGSYRRRVEKGFSNLECTATISSNTIDLTNTTVSAAGGLFFNSAIGCGIINLTSTNATESVEKIIGLTTSVTFHDLRFIPESDLTVTFVDKATATIAGKNLDLENSIVVPGATKKYLQIHKNMIDGTGAQPTDFYLSYSNVFFGSSYTLPTASTTVLGGVKVDGTTITIDGSGVISAATGTNIYNANGTLTGTRTVTQSTFQLTFSGSGTSNTNANFNVTGTAANGLAMAINSAGRGLLITGNAAGYNPLTVNALGAGFGTEISSVDANALYIRREPSSTNTVVSIAQISRFTTGTAANGIGGAVTFTLENSAGSGNTSTELISRWSNATSGSEASEFAITTKPASLSPAEVFLLKSTGQLQLAKYTGTTFDGTASKSMGVDASGNVITFTPASISTNNVTTGTDVLISNSGNAITLATPNFSATARGVVTNSGTSNTTDFLRRDGTWAVPPGSGTATPAGSNTQIQYNNSGAFGADPDLTFTAAGNILGVGGSIQNAVGSISTPSYSFTGATSTGMYYTSVNGGSIRFTLGGVQMGNLNYAPVASTGGQGNLFLGYHAGELNYTVGTGLVGLNNTAVGDESFINNDAGQQNTAFGSRTLHQNTSGDQNTALGQGALYENITGIQSVATGFHALLNVVGGGWNTAVGALAMEGAVGSTAVENTAVGNLSQGLITSGQKNVSVGRYTLYSNTTGLRNTAIGTVALIDQTSGDDNTALGANAGYTATPANHLTTGQRNTFLGSGTGFASTTQRNNSVAIGYAALVDASNTIVLGTATESTAIGGTTAGAKLDVYGDLKVQTVANDNTETNLVVWNSTDKVLEYRTVASLPSGGANALGTYIVQTATNAPANAQILASLGTGIVKNTTTTGVLSIAVAGDFPTLNQNTTGSAGSVSGTNVITNANLRQSGAKSVIGNSTNATANVADISSSGADQVLVVNSANTALTWSTVATGGITNNAVTVAKIQQIATATFLGRVTAATGNVEVLTGTQATTLLDVFSSTLKGLVPASGGGTTNYLRADGSWGVPAGTGANALGTYIVQTATNAPANAQILASLSTGILKVTTTTGVLTTAVAGDFPTLNQNTTGSAGSVSGTNVITNANLRQSGAKSVMGNSTNATANVADISSSGADQVLVVNSGNTALTWSTVATGGITNNAVTVAKIQQIATASFLGRVTAATGNVEVLTGTQATTLLDVFSSTLKGLVPASGGGTTNYLRADGTWQPVSGSGANALGTYIVQTATNAPANAQILASLGTGLVKNTTTTGVLSIAVAADIPDLSTYYIKNQTSLQSSSNFHISNNGQIDGVLGIGAAASSSSLDVIRSIDQYVAYFKSTATALPSYITVDGQFSGGVNREAGLILAGGGSGKWSFTVAQAASNQNFDFKNIQAATTPISIDGATSVTTLLKAAVTNRITANGSGPDGIGVEIANSTGYELQFSGNTSSNIYSNASTSTFYMYFSTAGAKIALGNSDGSTLFTLQGDNQAILAGNFSVTGYADQSEIAAPATPSAGTGRWYTGTDSHPHYKSDGGIDYDLSLSAATSNFANTDLTATANRTHDFAGFSLTTNNLVNMEWNSTTSNGGLRYSKLRDAKPFYTGLEMYTQYNGSNAASIGAYNANDASSIYLSVSRPAGYTEIAINPTDLNLRPYVGALNIDTLNTSTGSNQRMMTWDVSNGRVGYQTIPTGGGGTTLAALTDVTLTSLATNDFLKYNGTVWINRTPANVKTDLSLNNVENTALSTWVGTSNITTLGTVTIGTWNASLIVGQYGGTGVNNSGKTITLGGNLTTSGAFATTLTVTATTGVTLPTTGTLATLAGTETFTGKTISGSSNTITNIDGSNISTGTVPSARLTSIVQAKAISIQSPTTSENATLFYTTQAITITNVREVLLGTSPSVTYTLNYGSSTRATVTNAIVSSHAATSTAGADATLTAFVSIPAGSYIWLTTSATSGTVNEINVTVSYTQQ